MTAAVVTAAAVKWAWYVSRSGGIVAWLATASSVGWGLMFSSKLVRGKGLPAWLLALHKFLGLLAVVFTGLHLLGLWLDDYLTFRWAELLVPGRSAYRPLPVAIGIVGLYLLLAVEVTSLLMKRLPRRWWRRVHMLSFPLLALATLHGVLAGTDATNAAVQWAGLVAVVAVLFCIVYRLVVDPKAGARARAAAGSAAPVVSTTGALSGSLRGPARP